MLIKLVIILQYAHALSNHYVVYLKLTHITCQFISIKLEKISKNVEAKDKAVEQCSALVKVSESK